MTQNEILTKLAEKRDEATKRHNAVPASGETSILRCVYQAQISSYNEAISYVEQLESEMNYKTIKFGMYKEKPIEWYVISEDGEHELLLAKECIAKMAFNKELRNIYHESDVRKFLLDLEEVAFDAQEREQLLAHKSLGDKVFLLSEDEKSTVDLNYLVCDSWWWLRSHYPSDYSLSLMVDTGGSDNRVDTNFSYGSVRPAILLKKA